MRLLGDCSYGMYSYGFVWPFLARVLPELSPYASLLLSIPMAGGLAALSWHVVATLGLRLGRRLTDGTRVARGRPVLMNDRSFNSPSLTETSAFSLRASVSSQLFSRACGRLTIRTHTGMRFA